MKRLLLAATVIIIGAVRTFAQLSAEVSMPKFYAAALITGEKVNMRKAPSAQSQKLMKSGYGRNEEYYWGKPDEKDRYSQDIYVAHPYAYNTCRAEKTVGDWVQIDWDLYKPYVSKDFCRLYTADDFAECDEDAFQVVGYYARKTGKYKDYYFRLDDMAFEKPNGFYYGSVIIARKMGNALVETNSITVAMCHDTRASKPKPYRPPLSGDESFDKAMLMVMGVSGFAYWYGDNLCKNPGEDNDIDFRKFLDSMSDEQLEDYFGTASLVDIGQMVYFKLPESNAVFNIYVPSENL